MLTSRSIERVPTAEVSFCTPLSLDISTPSTTSMPSADSSGDGLRQVPSTLTPRAASARHSSSPMPRFVPVITANAIARPWQTRRSGTSRSTRTQSRTSLVSMSDPVPDGPLPASTLTLTPIGVVRSPFQERMRAPRQPGAALGVAGTIELYAGSGIEHALEDIDSFRHIWVLFWFHRNHGFRPKVLPPRSQVRRGVFSTRSPYRPNPIGLSVVELLKVEGRVLSVQNLDILDGTPVLDLKPYVPYTDAIPDASNGWLESARAPRNPLPEFRVEYSPLALEQLAFVETHESGIREGVDAVLRLGPQPHPYRRIKREQNGFVLAHKAWRISFESTDDAIFVRSLKSGYRLSELFGGAGEELKVHRQFAERFG
ncbi:MAG: tRNA (N6-threonylcarbamoyladenosine(37)-N6)-methyltransferase TrmO [Polyangiaceae bacterium]